jgi:class 3 adenylate cyclase
MSLFEEVMLAPIADRAIPWTEMRERTVVPGMRVLEVGRSMLSWLLDQHRVQDLNRLNYESVERMLALSGIPPAAPRRPAAIVFADLAGYTRLTEELGDEVAAASATRLAAIADEVAQRHHGRLVKLLGDGVMLHFSDPPDAVAAAIAIRDAMGPAGLPAAHIGIDAGAVIRREADYFGRTVNVAARLASVAGAGEILVSASLVTAAGDLPSLRGAEQLAPLELKGIPEPVAALRLA